MFSGVLCRTKRLHGLIDDGSKQCFEKFTTAMKKQNANQRKKAIWVSHISSPNETGRFCISEVQNIEEAGT